MLSTLLGDDESVAPLKRLIAEKTEGNPLFMEEIYRALIEEGVLVRDGTLRITQPLNALKIPATVQAILAARIDRLPAEQKDLLETVAVIGKDFRLGLVGKVAARPQDELEHTLAQLQLAEFIYEQPATGDIEYTFKHPLTHEAAYNSVLIERRKALHERIAQGIEELDAKSLDDHLAELAHHYERSGNRTKAVDYLTRAGSQIAQRSAWPEAMQHFERALAILKEMPASRSRDLTRTATSVGNRRQRVLVRWRGLGGRRQSIGSRCRAGVAPEDASQKAYALVWLATIMSHRLSCDERQRSCMICMNSPDRSETSNLGF